MILIAYDGSEDAKAAIARGGELLRGQPATVLTVWQPFIRLITHAYGGLGMAGLVDQQAIDKAAQATAEERAREGAQLARDAGLDAQARTCAQTVSTADAILGEGDAIGATAILMGSRGLTGLKSALLGSVSSAVLHHADLPVIVIPSPEVGAARARERSERSSE